MDVMLQRRTLEKAIPVVGCANALRQRLERITKSYNYLKLMEIAERNDVAMGNFDVEMKDLAVALDRFHQFMKDEIDAGTR